MIDVPGEREVVRGGDGLVVPMPPDVMMVSSRVSKSWISAVCVGDRRGLALPARSLLMWWWWRWWCEWVPTPLWCSIIEPNVIDPHERDAGVPTAICINYTSVLA